MLHLGIRLIPAQWGSQLQALNIGAFGGGGSACVQCSGDENIQL